MNLEHICIEIFRTFDCDQRDPKTMARFIQGLFSDMGTYEEIETRIRAFQKYRAKLSILLQQPLIEQRSPEWYALRKQRLTASDTAQALNMGKFGSRSQLVTKKAMELQGIEKPFKTLPAMQWGIMFEAMALRCYQQRYRDVFVHEFGLIPHPTLECYGASPDGITDLGIMVEIKCPYKRKIIPGDVPEYYELQMQGQMAVCGLKECDYIECDMQVFDSYEDYIACIEPSCKVDHGIILEQRDQDKYKYMYSPPYLIPSECAEWASRESCHGHTVKYWRLRQICIQRVIFDEPRWNGIVPQLQQFWNDVIEESKNNLSVPKKSRYEFIADDSD
jgi:putative phage-type endonuclease